nr:hypothetical protein BJQ95_03658 [Cryobacterium sp. SO1]
MCEQGIVAVPPVPVSLLKPRSLVEPISLVELVETP